MTTPTTRPPRHRAVDTPAGRYLIAADVADGDDAITGIWRKDQSHFPTPERLGTEVSGPDQLLDEAARQLVAYLENTRDAFDLPLRPGGTDFQQRVWRALREIPRGETSTYGALARDLGSPRAAQAVGGAVGSNPISIAIPCHRVLGADGSLTGYAGGTGTKTFLLQLEGVSMVRG